MKITPVNRGHVNLAGDARCSLVRTSGTAISAKQRNADVSSGCVGGHKGACRYPFGDEKGRGRIRNVSSAGA